MRTAESAAYGNHGLTREQAEPFAIQMLRATFLSYPPAEQERIRTDVRRRLADEARSREFSATTENGRVRHMSALARLARDVYGIE